jgi:hypothetical protein
MVVLWEGSTKKASHSRFNGRLYEDGFTMNVAFGEGSVGEGLPTKAPTCKRGE